jgi:hypothetical protein
MYEGCGRGTGSVQGPTLVRAGRPAPWCGGVGDGVARALRPFRLDRDLIVHRKQPPELMPEG